MKRTEAEAEPTRAQAKMTLPGPAYDSLAAFCRGVKSGKLGITRNLREIQVSSVSYPQRKVAFSMHRRE